MSKEELDEKLKLMFHFYFSKSLLLLDVKMIQIKRFVAYIYKIFITFMHSSSFHNFIFRVSHSIKFQEIGSTFEVEFQDGFNLFFQSWQEIFFLAETKNLFL